MIYERLQHKESENNTIHTMLFSLSLPNMLSYLFVLFLQVHEAV